MTAWQRLALPQSPQVHIDAGSLHLPLVSHQRCGVMFPSKLKVQGSIFFVRYPHARGACDHKYETQNTPYDTQVCPFLLFSGPMQETLYLT